MKINNEGIIMDTRRNLLKLILSGSGLMFFGCASSSSKSEIQVLDKKYQELEKKRQVLETIKRKYRYQYSVLEYVKRCFNYSLKVMENTNFETKIEEKYPIDITFTFPYWFGPDLALTKNEYFIRKYANDDLLFFNFGLEGRINNMYRYRKDLFGKENSDSFVKKHFGKDSVKDLFVSIYYKVTSFNDIDLFIWLRKLDENHLIHLNSLLDLKKIELINYNFIKYFYSRYLGFEYSLDPKNYPNVLKEIPLKAWKFTIDGKSISFTREDYIPYVFSLMIMERMIVSVKNKPSSFSLKSLNQIII